MIALRILVKAVVLGLVVAGWLSQQLSFGQSLAATVVVVDTLAAVFGLALALRVRWILGTLDVNDLSGLRG